MPIIIDITEAGSTCAALAAIPEGRGRAARLRGDFVGCANVRGRQHIAVRFQPNFQRREIQHLWNLEVIELRLLLLWNVWPEKR